MHLQKGNKHTFPLTHLKTILKGNPNIGLDVHLVESSQVKLTKFTIYMQGWLRVEPRILKNRDLDHRIPPLIEVVEIEYIKGQMFQITSRLHRQLHEATYFDCQNYLRLEASLFCISSGPSLTHMQRNMSCNFLKIKGESFLA